jgi:hypothetical protein
VVDYVDNVEAALATTMRPSTQEIVASSSATQYSYTREKHYNLVKLSHAAPVPPPSQQLNGSISTIRIVGLL